jgi:hypothetical protein
MDKYTKNQQAYIDSLDRYAEEAPQSQALAIIGKQDMTIAMLLGALKMARLYLDHGYPITARITNNGPTIGAVIDIAIADAEKGGMRVVDSSQLVEVLLKAREKLQLFRICVGDEYQGGMEYSALMTLINDVLGIKETDGIAVPSTE